MLMKESRLTIPKFQSEAEEARWWFNHREETAGWMEQAISEGRTTNLAEILRNGGISDRHRQFQAGKLGECPANSTAWR